jgi:RimJ/RimL family protein N-acetyltransferase
MEIRKTEENDLPALLDIFAKARSFMKKQGNPTQWPEWYPGASDVHEDMAHDASYVVTDQGWVVGYFALYSFDENYACIAGHWLNDEPYLVVHRLASIRKGAGSLALQYAMSRCPNVRVDTHKDNKPMKALLRKLGFVYCGLVPLLQRPSNVREGYMWSKII